MLNTRWPMRLASLSSVLLGVSICAMAGAHSDPSIVGTWRLVSFVARDSNGTYRPVWGDHPSGLIVYTADGRMAAQLYDPARARVGPLASVSPLSSSQPTYVGLYTYFGTYVVDTVARTVSHHVEGAMAPDWVGGTLVRGYRFLGANSIELRVLTDAAGKLCVHGTGTFLIYLK